MILDGRNRCQLWCCHIWMFYLWICQVQKLEGGNIGHLDGHYSEPLNVQILCENKTNYIFRLVETSQNHWRSKRNLHFSAVSGTLFSTSGVASLMLPLAWAFRASGKRPRENLMLLCSWKSCCSRWVPDLYFMAPQATFRRKRGFRLRVFFGGGAWMRNILPKWRILRFNFQLSGSGSVIPGTKLESHLPKQPKVMLCVGMFVIWNPQVIQLFRGFCFNWHLSVSLAYPSSKVQRRQMTIIPPSWNACCWLFTVFTKKLQQEMCVYS